MKIGILFLYHSFLQATVWTDAVRVREVCHTLSLSSLSDVSRLLRHDAQQTHSQSCLGRFTLGGCIYLKYLSNDNENLKATMPVQFVLDQRQ